MNAMADENLCYRTCAHIRPEGNLCMSPALKTSRYCYFHNRERQRERNFGHAADLKRSNTGVSPEQLEAQIMQSLGLPDLEDPRSLQIALSTIIRAIIFGHLSPVRAGLALRGLRTAVHNQKNIFKRAYSHTFAIEDPDPIHPLISPCAPDPWEFSAEEESGDEEADSTQNEASSDNPERSEGTLPLSAQAKD